MGHGLKFKTFSCYHRFFSQARRTIDSMGRVIVAMVLKFIPQNAPIVTAIDDTLSRKTGKRIWGAGMHHDPILSTEKRCVFSFGYNWVVLSIQLRFAFAPDKVWSLPILMRLNRRKQKYRTLKSLSGTTNCRRFNFPRRASQRRTGGAHQLLMRSQGVFGMVTAVEHELRTIRAIRPSTGRNEGIYKSSVQLSAVSILFLLAFRRPRRRVG